MELHEKRVKLNKDESKRLKVISSVTDKSQEKIIREAVVEWLENNYEKIAKKHGFK